MRDVLIGNQSSACITVSNITVSGWQDFGNFPFSYGYFEKGTLPFPLDKGIILSTGAAAKAPGPNTSILSDGDNTVWLGDQDLERSIPAAIPSVNATALEFDFTVQNSSGISFQFMFLSEESYEGNCSYSDAFAFLIKKKGTAEEYENIALIPNTLEPVNSTSISGSSNCPRNVEYFGGFNSGSQAISSPTNYNGQTKVLTARKDDLIPGVSYHIKLVIADHKNHQFDSAVLLKAGSFVGKKDLGPDLLIATHNAVCEGESKILSATTAGATSYQWYKDGVLLPAETNATLQITGNSSNAGNYEVHVVANGCKIIGNIKVEIQPKALLDPQTFSFCDENLNGGIPISFSTLDSSVVTNLTSGFTVKYYLSPQDAQNGTGTPLQDGWLLTADTDIFVRVESAAGCLPVTGKIRLVIGAKTPLLNTTYTAEVCDNTRSGSVQIDLSDYLPEFSTSSTATVQYYNSVADAKNSSNPITATQTLSGNSKTFGIRIQEANYCPEVAEIIVLKKTPNLSTVLNNKTICGSSTTTLDAGAGFDYYRWSTGEEGETKSSITNVPVGSYWVELTSNGCVYRQTVEVRETQLPQITQIDVSGSTATVFVTGGLPPYEYSLDSINFQSSNIFVHVERGMHTVYVRDAARCAVVQKQFLLLNLLNSITPDGDGINDVLDYSDLSIKSDVVMEIYDRYGAQVFRASMPPYRWDGKRQGRSLPTASYWYVLRWIEPDTGLPAEFSGWILLKNRN